jgi:hypothetical protein
MSNSWKNLTPHRPLDAGDPLYVPRPEGGGEELASLVKGGFNPIAVAGPMGCGKSTEIAAAAGKLREAGWVAVVVQLDRLLDMHQFSEDGMFAQIIESIMASLRAANAKLGLANMLSAADGDSQKPSRDRLLLLVRAMTQHPSTSKELALFIDGLEKSTTDKAEAAIRALLSLRDETKLIIVVPPSLVTGPAAYSFTSQVDKVFPVRPVWATGTLTQNTQPGWIFFHEITWRRVDPQTLGVDPDLIISLAISYSGGVPRVFLQILRDALRYASLAERSTLSLEDLRTAIKDQAESLERLLGPGDVEALHAADGTNGSEVSPIERRLRFLVHGLLLEYKVGDRIIVHPAPLLTNGALAQRGAA